MSMTIKESVRAAGARMGLLVIDASLAGSISSFLITARNTGRTRLLTLVGLVSLLKFAPTRCNGSSGRSGTSSRVRRS